MRSREVKSAAVSALRASGNSSAARVLGRLNGKEERRLLRWLDESGLALYLLDRLQKSGAVNSLSGSLRSSLEERLSANRIRTVDLLAELRRVMDAFEEHSVEFCVLKGFSLTPDFCAVPYLRHQTDLDFVIAPNSVAAASKALSRCGYSLQETGDLGVLRFATPLEHTPTAHDNIYLPPRHKEVDLRTTLKDSSHGVSIEPADDYLERVRWRTVDGICFPSLATEDVFFIQVMHAFRHLLGSWVRLSWLYEVSSFIDSHYEEVSLWRSIRDRAPDRRRIRDAFGLMICLTNELFPRPIPRALGEWCVDPLPSRMRTWVKRFGPEVAMADLAGSKLTLLIHREFLTDMGLWRSYLLRRIFPIGGRSSLDTTPSGGLNVRVRSIVAQWRHGMQRALFHASELLRLSLATVRWKLALRENQNEGPLPATGSD